ncbi:MAG: hypothetical protein KDB27_03940 [Planctomycetales bacterium]|nr:hypothetical protein [Planctomycetales bacterium]
MFTVRNLATTILVLTGSLVLAPLLLHVVVPEKSTSANEPPRAEKSIDTPKSRTHDTSNQVPPDTDVEQWYTFQSSGDHAKPNEISMADWLEKPAGKHGRIVSKNDELIYNGQPIKLWGLNVCYAQCAPQKELANRRAAFYAKMGINSVRLHKYADGPRWAGIQADDSFVDFNEDALDRMDYFVAQLKKHGIYVKLSPTFHVGLGEKQRSDVPYMAEFGSLERSHDRVKTGGGSIYFLRELQDLQIEQIVRILQHKNPYTGLTYAEDPAVAVVELFNEDSIFFHTTMDKLGKIPTVRRRAASQFCKWLKQRYVGKQALLQSWGRRSLDAFAREGFRDESWEQNTIVPVGNPWFYDPTQLAGSQSSKKRRLMDTMLFLYEVQNEFYDHYVDSIRKAGYDGEILSSNWQAGRAFSHYYNLHSDRRIGLIDRHNYFGGGRGEMIKNSTLLAAAGSGMLSVGMQQVADRPFMLSEWIHVLPNEWGVEGPALVAAYGMGLNGWDVSYLFQNKDNGSFSDQLDGTWNATAPNVIGLFPAVARQVLRGDVEESAIPIPRYVHMPSLAKGNIGFTDKVTQEGDVKTFDSDKVPARALAVGRNVVKFTDEYRTTPQFNVSSYVRDGAVVSSTNQLRWYEGQANLDGYVTINTPATQAVVGFADGKICELDDVTITPKCRFGAVYVTAREHDQKIDSARSLLIVGIARARNTGQKVLGDRVLAAKGHAPIVMEPIAADIQIPRGNKATVHVLDHDGCKTGKTLPVKNGIIQIRGARDKTCYYLISYPD